AVTLLRLLTEGNRHAAYAYFGDVAQLRTRLAAQRAHRGHLAAAARDAREDPRLWIELARLGAVDADTVQAVVARWLRDTLDSARWALPWWADRRDTASLRAL